MNEPVFKNSMFSDDKSYEISIHSWVCIQNATTGYKRGPNSSELQSEHFFNCVGAGKHRCDFRTYQRALISR